MQLTLNFSFPDINEKFVVELVNGTLHHIKGYQSENADATITMDRTVLNNIILQKLTLYKAIEDKKVTIEGNQQALTQLLGLMDSFNFWFNIVTPNH